MNNTYSSYLRPWTITIEKNLEEKKRKKIRTSFRVLVRFRINLKEWRQGGRKKGNIEAKVLPVVSSLGDLRLPPKGLLCIHCVLSSLEEHNSLNSSL